MKPQSHTYPERLPRPATSEAPATGWAVGRALRGLRTFARRNPLSAFWGCVALLIIGVSLLQSDKVGRWLGGLWRKKEAA